MPISQALYTGVTGLAINGDGMAVVANNLANANSKGFKRDRAEFEDLLSVDLSSVAGLKVSRSMKQYPPASACFQTPPELA